MIKFFKRLNGLWRGICYLGVGKLIFITGTVRTFSCLQTLKYCKDDFERLGKDYIFSKVKQLAIKASLAWNKFIIILKIIWIGQPILVI